MDFGAQTLGLFVGWVSLVLGVLSMAMGLLLAWNQRNAAPPPAPTGGLGEQGLQDVIKTTTDFAKALKDLDRAAQLFTIGVLFVAIAGLVAGLDSIAEAIKATAPK